MGNEHEYLKKEFNNNNNIEKNSLKKSKYISDDENNFSEDINKRKKEKEIENYDKEISKMLFDDEIGPEEKTKENKINNEEKQNNNLKSIAQQIADEQFMEEINRSKSLNKEIQKNKNKNKQKKMNIKIETEVNIKNIKQKESTKLNTDTNIKQNKKNNEYKKINPANKKRNFLIRMFTPIKKLKKYKEEDNKKSKNINNITSPNVNLNYKKAISGQVPTNKVFKEEEKNTNINNINATSRNSNNNKKEIISNENINKGYISEGNILRPREIVSNKKKIVLTKDVYDQIKPEDLKTVLLYMKNSNNKYQEGLDLFNNKKFNEAKDCFNQSRASFMNLNKLVNNNPTAYPNKFRVLISLKINEKMRETLKLIKDCNSFLINDKPEKTSKSQGKSIKNLNFNLIHKKSSNNINKSKKINSNSNTNIRYKNNLNINNKDLKHNIKKNVNNLINNTFNKNNKNENKNFKNENNKINALNTQKINEKNNIKKIKVNNEIPLNNNKIIIEQKKDDNEIEEKILSEILIKNINIKLNDIIGMKELKKILNSLITKQKEAQNILVFGPPGIGKTIISKVFAYESRNLSFYINTSFLISKYLIENENSVKILSELIIKKSPKIIIYDEIDSIFNKNNNNEKIQKIKKEFLAQFDSLINNKEKKVLIISITNKPMDLDDELLKRFSKKIYCEIFDKNERYEYLMKTINKVEHSLSEKDIKEISKLTEGYSNNDLEILCKEAALEPVRELDMEQILKLSKFRKLTKNDFVKCINKVKKTLNHKNIEEFKKWKKSYC